MALTTHDVVMDADLFRLAQPHWPHPEPEYVPSWRLERDRIGTALLNGRIDEATARERLLANGGTGREADHQLAIWRRPAVSFADGDGYAQERADYCC